MKLSEQQRKDFLRRMDEILQEEDVKVEWSRSVVRTTKPGDEYETYKPGHGRKIWIEVPCKKDDFYMGRS